MSVVKDETYLAPGEIEEIKRAMDEVSSTRWPIAVSLVDLGDDGRTATELSRVVGKSVSWTLKQAKQMVEAGILEATNDPLNQSRGCVYRLNGGVKGVLEQCDEYEATLRSLERGSAPSLTERMGQIVTDGLEIMALDAEATMIGYGFIPVSVVKIGTGDKAQYRHVAMEIKPLMVADGVENFAEILRLVREWAPTATPTPTPTPTPPGEWVSTPTPQASPSG